MKKRKKKWLKFRHRVVRVVAGPIISFLCKLKYGVKIEKFRKQGDRQYLILMNHQTPFDQFFVGLAFKGPVYYLATEDIFSLGFLSSLLRWAVAPIPIKKQTTDVSAVMNCMRVAKEGGTIALAPEGNRTYSGKTEYMNPAIASFAKKLGLPIALYRIEGGYGACPRWSDVVRKGAVRSYVSEVIEPEVYNQFTNEELMERIEKGLYVDEGVADGEYRSNKRAEYLERAMYVCPSCGLVSFYSSGNECECLKCHRKVTYGVDKRIRGVGFDFPFEFVTEWYDYQKEFVNSLQLTEMTDTPLFCDTAALSEVVVYKNKNKLKKSCEIKLYGDRVVIDEGTDGQLLFKFSDTSAVSVLGRNKLNIYYRDKVYQLKGDKHFNALKYVNLYYRFKNITRGETVGGFLGL